MLQTNFRIPSAEQIRRYGVTGPRFTSYPTALAFSDEIGDDAFLDAVHASNDQLIPAPLSLYAHVPFCQSLCYFCACHKKVTRNRELIAHYVKALQREIAHKATLIDNDRTVRALHWGGGTPSYLTFREQAALMGALSDHFPLASHSARDFSIEIDPRSVDSDDLEAVRSLGFNRVSFGVQDFDLRVQTAVNRIQSFALVAGLVQRARQVGFRSISIDLIYGLPGQTVDSFSRTVERVTDLRPDALSVFNYAHLPARFPAQRLLDEDALPEPAERIAIFQETIGQLCDAGYEYIGMDHFALPMSDLARARREGNLHRCFQGYATGADSETLAFGVSAISHIGDGYFQVQKRMPDYLRAIDDNGHAIARGYRTTAEDRRVAEVIQAIMCYGHCDKDRWSARNSAVFDEYFADELERLRVLIDDGLVVDRGDVLQVSPMGWPFLRTIAGCFDRSRAHLGVHDSEFSKAV